MSMIYSADAFKPMLKYNKNICLYICQKKNTLAGGTPYATEVGQCKKTPA